MTTTIILAICLIVSLVCKAIMIACIIINARNRNKSQCRPDSERSIRAFNIAFDKAVRDIEEGK